MASKFEVEYRFVEAPLQVALAIAKPHILGTATRK